MNPVRSHRDSSVAQLLGFQIQEDVVSYNVTCHILPYLKAVNDIQCAFPMVRLVIGHELIRSHSFSGGRTIEGPA